MQLLRAVKYFPRKELFSLLYCGRLSSIHPVQAIKSACQLAYWRQRVQRMQRVQHVHHVQRVQHVQRVRRVRRVQRVHRVQRVPRLQCTLPAVLTHCIRSIFSFSIWPANTETRRSF